MTDDREARRREIEDQLYQLDREARVSALTPGEAAKNRDERDALDAELRALGESRPGAGNGDGFTDPVGR